ncbi:MAG: hypothetical protein WC358_03550 [Ignavibacteria bacterium]|jgi:hypothetical protein
MEKKLIRVQYNEKRLQFLDAALPYLVLKSGEVLYNFDYYVLRNATFIRELNEFNAPVIPFKLWNFAGEDLHTYHDHIEFLEFDQNIVYEAAKEVYPEESEEFWLGEVDKHYAALLEMTDGICEARSDIESTKDAERKEHERRQNLLQEIADRTAHDEDALPTPEVMQLRQDAANKMLAETFSPEPSSEIITEQPKIITSAFENTPTKLVL